MTVYEQLPPVELVRRPKTYRQTFLRLADTCLYSAYLYAKHEGGVPSAPLLRGRVFHEVAERCAKACREHGETRVDPHHAKAILDEVLREFPEWGIPVADMDALRIMVHHFAENFVLPADALIEQLFHLRVGDSIVSGTVDLAWVEGDTLYLRDYKAGYGLVSQSDLASKDPETGEARGAKAFQLIVYCLLIADGWPVASDWILPPGVNRFDTAFVYPFFTDDGGMVQRGVVIDRLELVEHRSWLELLVNRVDKGFREGRWTATPGSHCSRCPSPQECPIPPYLRKQHGTSPFERDPSELAEEYLFMTADTKRLRGELKAYAERFGAIPIGSDQELSHKRMEDKNGKVSTRFDVRRRGEGF